MGAVRVVLELPRSSTACVVINATFKNAGKYAERLRSTHLFDVVCLLDPVYGGLVHPTIRASLCKEEECLRRLMRVYSSLKDRRFDVLVCPGAVTLAIDLKRYFVPDGYTILLDDGTGSRYGTIAKSFSCLDDIITPGELEYCTSEAIRLVAKKVFRLITGDKYILNIRGILLFGATAYEAKIYSKIRVMPLSTEGCCFQEIVKQVFIPQESITSYANKLVFFGYPDNVSETLLSVEAEVVQTLQHRFGNRLLYRMHPRRTNTERLAEGVIVDKGDEMWEALWAIGKCNDDAALIGFGSTAQVAPKVFFGKEPIVVFLHQLSASSQKQIVSSDRAVDDLRRRYTNPNKICVPQSHAELLSQLTENISTGRIV